MPKYSVYIVKATIINFEKVILKFSNSKYSVKTVFLQKNAVWGKWHG